VTAAGLEKLSSRKWSKLDVGATVSGASERP